MNYRYKVDGENIIVSKDDDKKIQEAIDAGGGLVELSSGIEINTKFISMRKETTQMTESQEREVRNRPTIAAPVVRTLTDHGVFFKKMGWDWESSNLNPKNQAKRGA